MIEMIDFEFGALELEGPKFPCFLWEIHCCCGDQHPRMAAPNHYLHSVDFDQDCKN